MRKLAQSDKDRKVKERYSSRKLGASPEDPISPKSVLTNKLDPPYCETTYGSLPEEIYITLLSIDNYSLGHREFLSEFNLWNQELDKAIKKKKPPIITNRTTKQIAEDLIEKEKKSHRKKQRTIKESAKLAKKAALKARRREFESNRARLILLMLDSGKEYICSACETEENLTVDHIKPVSKGGTDDLENLDFLCQSCNSKKGTN